MILVTGAGGFIGRRLVARLLDAGYALRCLISPLHAGIHTPSEKLELHIHDRPDAALWSALVDGVHCIIHLRGAHWWGSEDDLRALEIEDTGVLLEAARAARVGRIILISHLDASPASGIPVLRSKGEQEQRIRASGLAYTIIRSATVYGAADSFTCHIAALLRANPLFFALPGRGEALLQPIHVNDLVEALHRSLSRLPVVDETVEIGGPEYLSFAELVLAIMRATDMQRRLLHFPPYLLRWLIRAVRFLLPRSLLTEQWLDLFTVSRTTGISNLTRIFAIQPQPLEPSLRHSLSRQRHLRALLGRSIRRRPRRVSV